MNFQILSTGISSFDNLISDTPLNWELALPRDMILDQQSWFSTGQVQLQLQIFFDITTNPEFQKQNTERFLNPSQLQIGHWAIESEGYTQDDGRLKYLKQAIRILSAQSEIRNTLIDARINLSNTINSQTGHAQSISDIPICGTERGIVPPDGQLLTLDNSSVIPIGAICLSTALGQTEFQEIEPYLPDDIQVLIDTNSIGLPDKIKGILWTGYRLDCSYIIGYNSCSSTAIPTTPKIFVTGKVNPAPYSYTCANGVYVPLPGFCPPGTIPTNTYNPGTGQGGYICTDNSPA
jgi:hypothetical protein